MLYPYNMTLSPTLTLLLPSILDHLVQSQLHRVRNFVLFMAVTLVSIAPSGIQHVVSNKYLLDK